MITPAFALLLALAFGQDAARYQQAVAQWQRMSNSNDENDRLLAARDLGNATFPERDDQTVRLLTAQLRAELSRRPPSRPSGTVLDAIERALGRVRNAEAVEGLLRLAARGNDAERFHILRALGSIPGSNVVAALVERLSERNPLIVIAAAQALAAQGEAARAGTQALLALARNGATWEHRVVAIRALGAAKDPESVAPLIEMLRAEYEAWRTARPFSGRIMDELVAALQAITNIKYDGVAPQEWERRWAAAQRGEDPNAAGDGGTVAVPTEFFGIVSRSTRIVFVLDTSGSMAWTASERSGGEPEPVRTGEGRESQREIRSHERAAYDEARRLYEEWRAKRVTNRIEALQKEFVRTIFRLDPGVYFGIVFFSDAPRVWRPELVEANWTNKLAAIRATVEQIPNGGTCTWDALEAALQFADQRGRIRRNDRGDPMAILNGADTIFLLSDGEPTVGRIVDKAEILSELRRVNLVRNVVIHTIALGDRTQDPQASPDPRFLERIANEHGGVFKHVTANP